MTNKSEMVSDFSAMTYKELSERLAHYLSSALVSAQYSMTDETMHDALGLCDQVTRRKSVPAEDVRAVVEEPVAYQVKVHGMTLYWSQPSESKSAVNTPLYRHPQRPFVLPERQMYSRYLRGVIPENRFEVEAYKDGWNACLDAVEDLNK